MKPSRACLACSTLFSVNARISGGISNWLSEFLCVFLAILILLLPVPDPLRAVWPLAILMPTGRLRLRAAKDFIRGYNGSHDDRNTDRVGRKRCRAARRRCG